MLDSGGDSVVLVSTIPSPFIDVADDLACQLTVSDDCSSEITSTVADDPTSTASSTPPSLDHARPSVTSHQTSSSDKPALTGCITTTTAAELLRMTCSQLQQTGRQKKSLEMVVNLLKRPSTTGSPHVVPVTSSGVVVSTSGHVVLNGCAADMRQSLLQRAIAAPSPGMHRQLPATTWSHFRFRSVAGNGLLPTRPAYGPPPIKQLKHMCKNVRSFVPSAQRRAAPWRNPAMELLFGAVPVTRHRAAAMHVPPRAGTYRAASLRPGDVTRPRFHAARLATSAVGVSRDRRPRDDEQLSLLSLLLEASGTSCRALTSSSTSLSTSYPASAQLWKAAI